MTFETVNPSTGRPIATFEALTDAALEHKLGVAERCEQTHKATPLAERIGWIRAAAQLLEQNQKIYAAEISREMGKPLHEATGEVLKCITVCDYYAKHAPALLADSHVETSAQRSLVRHLPMGTVLAIMPWNFPFWQVFRFAIPALAAGNVVLLKHAENTCGCSLMLESLFREAGVPEGGFQSLLISIAQTQKILADDRVRAATLTGSGRAGSATAETAGRHLKKVVLELGGSDPFIVMPSANIDAAVAAAARGRLMNAGQSCIAAKRIIVHRDVYSEFKDRLIGEFETKRVGDPFDERTDIGPLATQAILRTLERQVDQTVAAGATALTGGTPVANGGWFFPPTILADIPEASPAMREEFFGPVALLFEVDSLDDAITLSNDSEFGLGSVLFTQDEGEIEQAFSDIESGATFINTITASDPRMPFGGIKRSGIGRELAADGLYEFVNKKTCWVA